MFNTEYNKVLAALDHPKLIAPSKNEGAYEQ